MTPWVSDSRHALPRFVKAAGLALLSLGCQESAPAPPTNVIHEPLTCVTDDDCTRGVCDPELSLCKTTEFDFPGLLLEITPPATDTGFGGFRLYERLDALGGSLSAPTVLEVLEPPRVLGDVILAFPSDAACATLPVRLTLTPHETNLGLGARKLSTVSRRVVSDTTIDILNRYEFHGVPLGTYDLYWEDAKRFPPTSSECEVVPQIIRGLEVTGVRDLALVQPETRPLQVIVPWQDELDGWVVDIVHGATGQRMSTQRALSEDMQQQDQTGAIMAVADLRLSEVLGPDYPAAGELLRLRPPSDRNRPTILMDLAALEALELGVARVPAVETFAFSIDFAAWVWEEGNADKPVRGQVEFSASALVDVPDGIFVRYAQLVDIAEDGGILAALPPGSYRARVYPKEVGPSVFETSVTVWGPASGSEGETLQAGRVLEVPSGVEISGEVTLFGGVEAENTMVRVTPARRGGVTNALSSRAYSPRPANALADSRGRFTLEGVDCRGCDETLMANYVFSVQPPEASWLPWLVVSPFAVGGPLTLGELEVGLPALHFGQLTFRTPRGGVGPFPGAQIRAYVLLNREGTPVSVDRPSCVEFSDTGLSANCAHRAVQIGEARSGADGAFQLVLPPRLTSMPGIPR